MTAFQLVAFVAVWLFLSVVLGLVVGAVFHRRDCPGGRHCSLGHHCPGCCEMGRTPDVAPHGRRVRVRSISERPDPARGRSGTGRSTHRNGDAPAP